MSQHIPSTSSSQRTPNLNSLDLPLVRGPWNLSCCLHPPITASHMSLFLPRIKFYLVHRQTAPPCP